MVPGAQYAFLLLAVFIVSMAICFDRWHARHHMLAMEEGRLDSAGRRLSYLCEIIQTFFETTKTDVATKEFFEWLKGVSGDQYEEVLAQLKNNPSATAPALRIVTPPKQDGIDMHTT